VSFNTDLTHNPAIILWNNIFLALVVFTHVLVTAVLCSPNSIHFLLMITTILYTSFSTILQPKLQEAQVLKPPHTISWVGGVGPICTDNHTGLQWRDLFYSRNYILDCRISVCTWNDIRLQQHLVRPTRLQSPAHIRAGVYRSVHAHNRTHVGPNPTTSYDSQLPNDIPRMCDYHKHFNVCPMGKSV
jgi:hypothetical protein